jgi:penicillin-binding protein 2
VFPDQLPENFRKGLLDSFPGTGDTHIPIDPENWQTVTDGMYQVTQPGMFHTAGGEHLEGIDFGGKTGTAQQMSHEALEKTNKGKATNPNVWFVGVTPTKNPELVVAVLWQNGNKSWFAARIGARVVSAYVDKQRRLAHNLPPDKPAPPVEVGAVWTEPGSKADANGNAPERLQSGHFYVDSHGVVDGSGVVAENDKKAKPVPKPAAKSNSAAASSPSRIPSQLAAALPVRRKEE